MEFLLPNYFSSLSKSLPLEFSLFLGVGRIFSFYFLEFENLLLISYLLLVLKLDIFTFIFLITRIQKIQLLSLDLLKI